MQSPRARRRFSKGFNPKASLPSLSAAHRIKLNFALNRPVEDWGKLLSDVAAVSAMLDRLLHHGHVLKCGPRSWRTKTAAPS